MLRRLFVSMAMPRCFMPPDFVPHRTKAGFSDGNFVIEQLNVIAAAVAFGVRVFSNKLVKILGCFGIKPPQGVADGTGFDHD